jgi:hypothetical protein
MDRIENTVPSTTFIVYMAWHDMTLSDVASLFIVPLPSNMSWLSANISQCFVVHNYIYMKNIFSRSNGSMVHTITVPVINYYACVRMTFNSRQECGNI